MNDAEYIFQSESKEKKRIGNNVRHRENRGGSKKCSLPSDNLTPKQWKKMNGEVEMIKLNEKMDWDIFKNLTSGLQREYLQNMTEKYGARQIDIAEMLKISRPHFNKYCKDNFPDFKFANTGKRSGDERWLAFIRGEVKQEKEQEKVIEEPEKIMPEPIKPTAVKMEGGRIKFIGTVAAALQRAYEIFEDGREHEITIICESKG